MAKKTRKQRKTRRRTRRVKKGGSKFPIIPPNSAFPHSTAGESSDNLLGY